MEGVGRRTDSVLYCTSGHFVTALSGSLSLLVVHTQPCSQQLRNAQDRNLAFEIVHQTVRTLPQEIMKMKRTRRMSLSSLGNSSLT
jgi:hypothetical protein